MRIPNRKIGKISTSGVRRIAAAVLVPLFLSSAPALAAESTYRERMMMQDQSRKLSEEAEFTSEICGTRISASLRWDSFLARDGRVSTNVYRECDGALSAIERICRDESKVEALRKQLQRVECGGGRKTRVRLEDGSLRYAISRGDGGHQDVFEYLNSRF